MSIKIENLSYTYAQGSAYEIHALKNLSLEIHDGEFIGIIGHTGSGKSTLIQLLDGLSKQMKDIFIMTGKIFMHRAILCDPCGDVSVWCSNIRSISFLRRPC